MMFFLFCTLVALATATPDYENPHYVSSGTSQQYRTQDATGNYRFGYDESHASGGTFRDETGDAWGNKYGSYGLREADGRYRVVHYVADEKGFRAEVKTNEPGVAPKDPASTTIKRPFSQEPIVQQVIQEPVIKQVVREPVIKQVIREPVIKQVVREPVVQQQIEQEPIEQKPVLYAPPVTSVVSTPVIHHSYNPEYPLLYTHHNPYYGSYGTYKGTPFRTIPRFSTYYKGSPYYKGSAYVRQSAPYVTNHGYYIYP